MRRAEGETAVGGSVDTATACPCAPLGLLACFADFCNRYTPSIVLLYRTGERNRPIDTEGTLHTLFSQYGRSICRYLTRLTGDPNRAEELTQETFFRAYRALIKGERWDNPRAWLYRVASRLATDDYRRRKLLQWLPLRAADGSRDGSRGVEAATAERLAVQAALNQLPPKYRVPLVLHVYEGRTVAEVAETLGLSISAVKMRLSRAREMFRRAFREQETSNERVQSCT